MRRRPFLLLTALLPLLACAPSLDVCARLMPVPTIGTTPTTTPVGSCGCTGTADGVTVTVEALFRSFQWERGRVWLNQDEVRPEDFQNTLAVLKARQHVNDAAAQASGIAQGIAEQSRKVGASLRGIAEKLRKK